MTMHKIIAKIYLRHHVFASYELIFESETTLESFINTLNVDVDFIRVADDMILRKTIRKVKVEYVY